MTTTTIDNPSVAAPAVHNSQEALRILGTSVTQLPAVKAAAEADLGITLEFITLDGAAAQRRGALSPQSFDVYDQWFQDLDLVWSTGSLQPIDVARISRWDEINSLPKTGRVGTSSHRILGRDPSQRLYVQQDGSLGNAPSKRISMLPTVHNADGFAVLGDVDASSWGAFLDPRWAGHIALQSDPAIGALDMLLALQARGEMLPNNLGDITLEEIDALVGHLDRYRAAGQFCCIWTDEAEVVSAMREGKPMIGSLWWSGAIKLKAEGIPVRMVLPKEGCRGWFGGLALSVHLEERKKDAAYEYLNWWLDGRPGGILARHGAYMANHETVRAALSSDEWDFWYGGMPARNPIRDSEGREIYRTGEVREGGGYSDRMSRVVVWNTVMTEHNYLMRRWAHALS